MMEIMESVIRCPSCDEWVVYGLPHRIGFTFVTFIEIRKDGSRRLR